MQCDDAGPLIPSYLDGELSETQAAPLRKHLLDCQPCRATAQGEKAIKRWFVEAGAAAVPPGFASRVARRAFAGDTGSGEHGTPPLRQTAALAAVPAPEGGRLLPFVLRLTAVAAILLVCLSVAIGNLRLPTSRDMQADDSKLLTLEEMERALDRLNREEAAVGDAERPAEDRPGTTPAEPR
jgi:anti-sigma factor RsiW